MNIESIDLMALPSLLLSERAGLPDAPAIYFALDTSGTVLYIGKARRLSERWKGTIHHRYSQLAATSGVRIAWLSVTDEALLTAVETACIAYFAPPLNSARVLPSVSGRVTRVFAIADDVFIGLEEIAKTENRTVTAQMEVFLREMIKQYKQTQKRQPTT